MKVQTYVERVERVYEVVRVERDDLDAIAEWCEGAVWHAENGYRLGVWPSGANRCAYPGNLISKSVRGTYRVWDDHDRFHDRYVVVPDAEA